MPPPLFLSGEKRQAVYTFKSIPPEKKVSKIEQEINRIRLNNYLYVTCSLQIP